MMDRPDGQCPPSRVDRKKRARKDCGHLAKVARSAYSVSKSWAAGRRGGEIPRQSSPGNTEVGEGTVIFSFAVIRRDPAGPQFKGETSPAGDGKRNPDS